MTRLDKVKDHLKSNKKTYLVGAGALAVGVVGTLVTLHGRQIVINDSFNLSLHSPKENVVTTILERRGHPGNLVRCIETGEVFASQNRAAKVMDLNSGNLSKHLSGEQNSVGGYTFEILGLAV